MSKKWILAFVIVGLLVWIPFVFSQNGNQTSPAQSMGNVMVNPQQGEGDQSSADTTAKNGVENIYT